MRKIWMMLCLCMVTIWLGTVSANAAEITDVRWVTRNDAPIPFVRIVLDLTSPVKASAYIDKSGTKAVVTMRDAIQTGGPKTLDTDKSIITKTQLASTNGNTAVIMTTPSEIEANDVKVFSLKKDTVNKKPYRLVIDVQKKGVTPRSKYYGSKKVAEAANRDNEATKPFKSDLRKVIDNVTAKKIARTPNYRVNGGIKGKVVVLDPGHGGSDPGAIGGSGLMEKEVTLPIANALKKELQDRGAKVYMTRTTDVDVYGPHASGVDELQARVDVATKYSADAFVSIHINSFNNPTVGGIATYYYDKTPYDEGLASNVQGEIAGEEGFGGDRGIQPGDLYVLRHTDMPAVLVELGFISNKQEEKLLKTSRTQQDFARRIADGIEKYFGRS